VKTAKELLQELKEREEDHDEQAAKADEAMEVSVWVKQGPFFD